MSPLRVPSIGRATALLVPIIAALGGVGLVGFLFSGQLQQVKEQLRLSQQQAAQLGTQNQELTRQIDTLQTERNDLGERLTSLRAQLASAATDLERSRASLVEFQDRYERLDEERAQLQAEVERVTKEREETQQQLQQQLQRVEQENADLERSVSRGRHRLALLDRDYRKLAERLAQVEASPYPGVDVVSEIAPTYGSAQSSKGNPLPSAIAGTVELPPIVVRRDRAGMATLVQGRLIEVNEPHNFVVVDKGSANGVHIGMVFDILRGSSSVGRVTVSRVRPQLSACDIFRAKTPSPLQVGDLAVQSGNFSP
jgi:archaellum component FlaC